MTSKLARTVSALLAVALIAYQRVGSPFLHALSHTLMPFAGCRFQPTCSAYALAALRRFPLHVACLLIGKRLLRCHPFSSGGADPLPQKPVKRSLKGHRRTFKKGYL